MLVSIVTPTLNRRRLLEATLESVRGQSYPNIEHIVVDGGSTDGTIELLRSFGSTYNLKWISESDDGMYAAINKGLRLASGTILAYLNSDDTYLPWTIETVAREFERHRSGGFVFGDAINVSDSGHWRLILQPPGPSLYGNLRKEPRKESVSTIEAAAWTLAALEGDE